MVNIRIFRIRVRVNVGFSDMVRVRMSKWHFKNVNYNGKLAIYLYTMKK